MFEHVLRWVPSNEINQITVFQKKIYIFFQILVLLYLSDAKFIVVSEYTIIFFIKINISRSINVFMTLGTKNNYGKMLKIFFSSLFLPAV